MRKEPQCGMSSRNRRDGLRKKAFFFCIRFKPCDNETAKETFSNHSKAERKEKHEEKNQRSDRRRIRETPRKARVRRRLQGLPIPQNPDLRRHRGIDRDGPQQSGFGQRNRNRLNKKRAVKRVFCLTVKILSIKKDQIRLKMDCLRKQEAFG